MGGLGRRRQQPSRAAVSAPPARSPSRGRPCRGDIGERSCFRQAGDSAGDGIPASGGEACGGRRCERHGAPRPLPPSPRRTSPSAPLSLLYPPTSRPAGVRSGQPMPPPPPPPFFSPRLPPPQRPAAGEGPAARAAPEPAGVPRSPGCRPRRGAPILAAAPSPAQMLQTPLTCIDAMMEPCPPPPPRLARPETQGAELPRLRHAAGDQRPGRGGRGFRWTGIA